MWFFYGNFAEWLSKGICVIYGDVSHGTWGAGEDSVNSLFPYTQLLWSQLRKTMTRGARKAKLAQGSYTFTEDVTSQGITFGGLTFEGTFFEGTFFEDVIYEGVTFWGYNCRRFNFRRYNFRRYNFWRYNFRRYNFSKPKATLAKGLTNQINLSLSTSIKMYDM